MARGTAVRCHSTNMQALQRARVRRTLFLKNMSPIGLWQDMQGSKVAPDASSACLCSRHPWSIVVSAGIPRAGIVTLTASARVRAFT